MLFASNVDWLPWQTPLSVEFLRVSFTYVFGKYLLSPASIGLGRMTKLAKSMTLRWYGLGQGSDGIQTGQKWRDGIRESDDPIAASRSFHRFGGKLLLNGGNRVSEHVSLTCGGGYIIAIFRLGVICWNRSYGSEGRELCVLFCDLGEFRISPTTRLELRALNAPAMLDAIAIVITAENMDYVP